MRDPRTIALLLAGTLVIMAAPTISPALAGLQQRFSDEPHAAMFTRLLVPAPSLSVVLVAPFVGFLADRFGKSRMLLVGACLFALAGSAGLVLPSLKLILASRLVLGIAVAMIMTAQLSLIGDCFHGAARGRVMGWQISARNFGGMIFVSLGGFLAGIGPQIPFAIFGLAVFYIPLVWFAFRELNGPSVHGDEGIATQADIESDVAWLGPVLSLSALMMLTVAVFFQMPTQLPFFVVSRGLDGASVTGFALAALTFTGGVAALGSSGLQTLLGLSGQLALGFVLMASGFGVLTLDLGLGVLLVGTSLIGAGFAVLMPAFSGLLLQIVPPERRGTASGMLTTGGFVGQFLSPVICTPVISKVGFEADFLASMTILLVLGLGALVVSLAQLRAKAV
ncbi:MAG: MFS transporter [Rhodobacteraceae bacterium]|nr:MFS transporter [Paracoccaceae bacterium]